MGRPATLPIERSLDFESALTIIENTLRSAGLQWTVLERGELVHAATCKIFDGSGRVLATGHGKGDRLSSYVGAVFEAAEHLWSHAETCDPSRIVYKQAYGFSQEHPALRASFPVGLIEASPDALMPFRQYCGVISPSNSLYPLGLSCPSYLDGMTNGRVKNPRDGFDYRYLARYSSNSGVAIGATRSEAVVHGLLECVERDTVSKFMTDVFLKRDRAALRVVDQASLPPDLRLLVDRTVAESRQKLILLELRNRFGIPVFCAALDGEATLAIAGYGASLSRHHAVARSLHEVAQVFLIKTGRDWDVRHDERVVERLASHRFLLRCAKFDLFRECRNGYVDVSYDETASIDAPESVDDYLACAGGRLERHGAEAFTTEVRTFENGVTVAHTFFVGQDHFFLVSGGNLVYPSAQAVASAQSSTSDVPA